MQLQFTETKDIFNAQPLVILFPQFTQVFFPALQEFLATTTQLKAQENKNEKAFEAALKKFLQSSFYAKNYVGNKPYKKGEADLVISQGVDIQTNTAVLCEVKSPLDKVAMISQADFNKKCLQQAVTYFFTEIVEKKNFDLKRIVITNTEDFFIFDATEFHRIFYQSELKKAFENWHAKQQVGTSTNDFYTQVSNFINLPSLKDLVSLTCVHFNLNELSACGFSNPQRTLGFENPKTQEIKTQEIFTSETDFETFAEKDNFKELKFLYKVFSPQYLLKSTDVIDSNELNEPFYLELLHILGVEEITKSGKTIIQRKANNRDIGSFLELTMHEIASQKKTLNLDKTVYGHTQEEQIFHAALELAITWVNRMLFLKLLESQLINFNSAPLPPEGGAKNPPSGGRGAEFAFLNLQILPNFSEVFILFHKVLAIKEHERETGLQEKYQFVPYLNSSLFEISELEQQFININALGNGNIITVISSTVLQNHAKRLTTLDYFLRFLNSYNFSSEGKKQEVSQDNEPVINAAILGKIFEKINGYKDGAVFTPASITMYMCRRSIRLAVVQKFNEIKQWNCVSFEELKEKIEDKREANAIINTLKICDPAVGSGHFLVSALNEIIAIKSELGALFDRNNRRITDYKITVVNDELEIKDIYNDSFFVYRKTKIVNEIQLLQETLFHEKQTIIENCLFGVDINPNSVKICRLRLWIELLKNAYYIMPSPPTPEGGVLRAGFKTPSPLGRVGVGLTPPSGAGGLQTLPNIDINIKVGNSLISRFATDVDLKQVLKKIKYKVEDYRKLVNNYKNVRNIEEKYKIEQAIAEIKNGFRTEIAKFSDPRILRLQRIEAELFLRETDDLFNTGTDKKEGNGEGNGVERDKIKKLQAEKQELSEALEAVKNNIAYEWAFEWRFEFPEVLSDDGEFLGFDVVIGNPPYGVSQQGNLRIKLLENLGKVPDFEIYYFFINRSKQLLKPKGLNAFIIPNTILFNVFAKEYREQLFENWNIHELLDCTAVDVFKGKATVRNVLTFLTNEVSKNEILYKPTAKIESFDDLIDRDFCTTTQEVLLENNQNWALVFKLSAKTIELTRKIRRDKGLLKDYFPDISQGLIAYDKYQGQDEATIENRIFHSLESKVGWKKFLWGRDVTHYAVKWNEKEYINYCDGLANPRKPKYFKGERLLIREITNPRIFVGYTKEESYYDPAIIVILKNPNGLLHIKALLAILNSKLATFLHFNSSPKATKGAFPKILVNDIKSFPIPEISADAQKPFIKLVDKILLAKTQEKDTQSLENQIDKLVYELYNLTEEEIEVVGKSVK